MARYEIAIWRARKLEKRANFYNAAATDSAERSEGHRWVVLAGLRVILAGPSVK